MGAFLNSPEGGPWLAAAHRALPRILSAFDTDPLSATRGWGDRFHWAWKLIDFPNSTFQGAAHGLARLLDAGLLPTWLPEKAALCRIATMIEATRNLLRRDGSCEEAFPYESSFCVTALVAFDLLCALDLCGSRLPLHVHEHAAGTLRPMIRFLHRADETHAFISNHLATAAAALFRWARRSGEGRERAEEILDRVLSRQSPEGWFLEYQGADPGYQTLAMYYLADIHACDASDRLAEPLRRSASFLTHFAHPDGSFGGLYGSRNTRFFVPAGLEQLAATEPEAAALCLFMRRSSEAGNTVPLDAIDPGNLIPMWNAWCWAASCASTWTLPETVPLLPCQRSEEIRIRFPEAGIIIDNGPSHYQIINTHKGGVCSAWNKATKCAHHDGGTAARDARERLYTTQAWSPGNRVKETHATCEVEAPLYRLEKKLPQPWQFAVLRTLNCTIMRWRTLGEFVKKLLVRMLITGAETSGAVVRRRIPWGAVPVAEAELLSGEGIKLLPAPGAFSTIHMASQGYWQRQDDAA